MFDPNLYDEGLAILRKQRGLLLFEGIVFVLLGCLAIATPVLFTIATDLLLGVLFITGGLIQIYRSFKTTRIQGYWLTLVYSWLTFIAGCIMVTRPMIGIIALTSILIAYFFVAGITKLMWVRQLEGKNQKFWMTLNALLSIFLAIMIIAGLPQTASWVIGLLVGIDLLFFGLLLIGFSMSLPHKE